LIGSLLKVIGVHGDNNDFSGFFDKHRSHLFGRMDFAVPLAVEREILSAFHSSQLGRLPWTRLDRLLDFSGINAAAGDRNLQRAQKGE
jgi:hypothetical protein